jgi:hypothetical protein
MYSRVLDHGRAQWIVGSHVLGFLPPPVDESVVRRGCSRGEESCSLYLTDPFAIIDVKPRIFMENPNPCTIAIVPGSVAIAYRTSHRQTHKVIHRIT